jgi:glucan biosynthesis protein C
LHRTIFVFHSGRFSDLEDWHVKNPTTYFGMNVWTYFLAAWIMPLVFVISGASILYALGKGGVGKFVKDRTLRLLVPLAKTLSLEFNDTAEATLYMKRQGNESLE